MMMKEMVVWCDAWVVEVVVVAVVEEVVVVARQPARSQL